MITLKPAHILTSDPDRYRGTIARAESAFEAITAGETAPSSAVYLLSEVSPAADICTRVKEFRRSRKLILQCGDATVTKTRLPEPAKPSRKPRAISSEPMVDICVVLLCHPPYLKYLPAAVSAINAQTVTPAQKILCLDNCTCADTAHLQAALIDWRIVEGRWSSPNPARREAMRIAQTTWITYQDADDTVRPDWLENVWCELRTIDARVGILYSDQIIVHADGTETVFRAPSPDYWLLREKNYVSSHSCWRRQALLEAGGYKDTLCFDDWRAALDVTHTGYRLQKSTYATRWTVREGDTEQRHKADRRQGEDIRLHARVAIVSLLAGRTECLTDWATWLATCELPEHPSLYVLDNSCCAEFARHLDLAMQNLASRFKSVTVKRDGRLPESSSIPDVHRHVAALYNAILPHVDADYILTLEDDVVPPPDGFLKLIASMQPRRHVAAVSALYRMRSAPKMATAAPETDYWHGGITLAEARGREMEVGFIGGGFVLWNAGALHRALPMRLTHEPTADGLKRFGWDGNACADIRRSGWRLILCGFVECAHNCGSYDRSAEKDLRNAQS